MPGVEARAGRFPGPSLIPALEAIQRRRGWLPREELAALARDVHRPLYEIEGPVSFYPHFRTEPPPAVTVAACHDLSCWLHGADAALAELRRHHGDDADVAVTEVSCLGRCDRAPAVAVNGHPGGAADAGVLVEAARQGGLERARAATHRDAPWPNDPYADGEPRYRVLRALLTGALDPARLIGALDDAGLRGMGGAGFPTGRKWATVAAQPATPKYAICNADESEPGTFKDRQILATQPHLVLEGLLLGMAVVGAEEGWVFIRHEYGPEEDVLREELAALAAEGLLGDDVLGTGRRLTVELFTSPGGYILGEETALIECMEGHRGEPRNKPPFPGVWGLWGRPTLMNSVETFAHVPVIAERGAAWWRAQGTNGGTGLKFFAVSGHVARPGVYCVPLGTTARDLLAAAGGVSGPGIPGDAEPVPGAGVSPTGTTVAAFQPGGASSNFLGPEHLDVPLDFGPLAEAGSMLGSGALVVMAEGTDPLAAATNVLRFFRDESCGKCVPCRVGSTKAHEILSAASGDTPGPPGASGDTPGPPGGPLDASIEAKILALEETMRLTSICGLGQVALGPVVSVLGRARGAAAARPQPRR